MDSDQEDRDSDVDYEPDAEETDEPSSSQCTNKGNSYKCTFAGCEAVFPRPWRLQRHLNVHENKRPYKCTHEGCDKSYTNSSHLKRHMESHSIIAKTYTCKICSVSISSLSNLKRHYSRAHNPDRELYCQECQQEFRKKNRFEEHMESHKNAHKNASLHKCEKCGKLFITHTKLMKHVKCVHENKKEYKCSVENCSQVFEKWALMLKHRKTDHVAEFTCPECGLKFENKTRLRVHARVHTDERPSVACPYENCHRLYYFKRNLDQHIRSKHKGNKFICDICQKSLSTKQKIEHHIISNHLSEKKPFKRKAAAQRKDTGLAKRSALSALTGIQLSVKAEVELMKRNPAALLRDKIVEDYSSFSEDDKASDIRAKGV